MDAGELVARYDRAGEIPERAEITPDGFLRADAIFTRCGVFEYRQPDGSVRRELRHPDDVFHPDALASFAMVPVTTDHPPPRSSDGLQLLDASNARKLAVGWTGQQVRADGPNVRVPIVVMDSEAIAAIHAGRRFLSGGYMAKLDAEEGVFEGQPYTHRQRRIRGNHVAHVDAPRAGAVAQIRLDGHQALPREEGDRQMDVKLVAVKLDGLDYQAAPEVARALEKLQAEAGDLRQKLDAAVKEREQLAGRADALKADLEKAQKIDHAAAIAAGVKVRSGLLAQALPHLPEESHAKLDGLSDDEIRRAVILAKNPEAKLDGKSADYIAGSFDEVVKGGKARTDALTEQRRQAAGGDPPKPGEPRTDSGDPAADAARRAAERIERQSQIKAA